MKGFTRSEIIMFFVVLGVAVPVSAQNFAGAKPVLENVKADAKNAKADEMMNALTAAGEEVIDEVLPESADVAMEVGGAEGIVEADLPDETEVEGVDEELVIDEENLVEIPIGIPPGAENKYGSLPTVAQELSPAPAPAMTGDMKMDHSQHQMMMPTPAKTEEVTPVQTAPAVAAKPAPRVPAGASTLTVAIVPTTTTTPGMTGTLTLTDTDEGLWVKGTFQNVPDPGNHGIHIHENGSCAEGGAGAGDHFNPGGVQHGHLPEHGHDHAHAGDMGNVQIKQDGTGQLDVVLPDVGLRKGKYLVGGKAIILHASADVFSQPTGNAGARIGCGIIAEGK